MSEEHLRLNISLPPVRYPESPHPLLPEGEAGLFYVCRRNLGRLINSYPFAQDFMEFERIFEASRFPLPTIKPPCFSQREKGSQIQSPSP